MPLAAGALTLWIALSPWLWGFADSHSAVANHILFTFAFGPQALMIGVLRPAALATLAGGLWLALSPWVLGYATNDVAWLNELVSGGLLVVLCANAVGLSGLIHARRRRALDRATASAPATVEPVGSHS